MKNTFAKLFELKNHQVVLYKDFNSEEDEYNIHVISQLQSGVMMSTKLSYKDENDRDKFFNSLSESDADQLLNKFLKMIGLGKEVQS